MNEYDRENNAMRREGRVFSGGRNNTRCSMCGRPDAQYDGSMNDEGETIATCVDGEGCAERDDDWDAP